jgi:radical SAM-linked protein
LIGHLDLVRCFERLFRRAGLPLKMSEGFHPKPRMTFPLALSVGIAGLDEVMEMELAEPSTADELLPRLRDHAPPGLVISSVAVLPPEAPKARVNSVSYEVSVPPPRRDGLAARVAELRSRSSCTIVRPHRQTLVDLSKTLEDLSLREDVLSMRLRVESQGCAGPRDVLAALDLADLEQQGECLIRTAVELVP